MQPGTCFCGRPCPSSGSRPTIIDENGGWGSEIYCTRACALKDSMRALTARQAVVSSGGESFGMELTEEQLGHFTHYRRVRRAGRPRDSPTASGSPQSPSRSRDLATVNTPPPLPTATSSKPSSSISSTESPGGSAYLIDKPLPDLPTPPADFRILHPVRSFKRNISNRYPTAPRRPIVPHNRNSSLSSFADSARFTSHSVSTRATSIASSVDGDKSGGSASVSRNPSTSSSRKAETLGEVVEEDEGPESSNSPRSLARLRQVNLAALGMNGTDGSAEITIAERFAGFWMRHQERVNTDQGLDASENESAQDCGDEEEESQVEDGDDVESHYDPFELDQLLLRTPQPPKALANAASASASSSLDSLVDMTPKDPLNVVDISPLSLSRPVRTNKETGMGVISTKSNQLVDKAPVLAPPIELTAVGKLSPTVADENIPLGSPLGLAPPPNNFHSRHLLLPSPSGFPTTPSLSPFVSTPTSSPLSITQVSPGSKNGSIPKAPAANLSSRPLSRSRPVFTLHRQQQVPATGIPQERGSTPSSASSSPTRKLRLSPDAALVDFGNTPVVGPGRPLFLGLGIDIENENDVDESGAVEITASNENVDDGRATAQRCTVFNVRDQLRRAATSHQLGGGRRGAFLEDDCLTYYFHGSDDEYEDDVGDVAVLLRLARKSVL
ncbi:hypothetical protein FRB96_006397 [Tulasnella sp. 330]|nr:hypothetical protein FRB96_006397 [Tulasnella sp. 330]